MTDYFDVLDNVLSELRFRGSLFFNSELAAPWGFNLFPSNSPRFHINFKGDFYVGLEDKDGAHVKPYEIFMITKGSSHWIADEPGRDLISGDDVVEACNIGNPLFQKGNITHRLMCGVINFEAHMNHPLFDALPEIIHFQNLEAESEVWNIVRLIDIELHKKQKLTGPVIDRFTEILFLELLYNYIADNEESMGYIAALKDRRIYAALKLIHSMPPRDWTLTSLGKEIGMSHATLNRYFQETLNVAPMTYIKNVKLQRAHTLILNSPIGLQSIAEKTGFVSTRSLNKAFKQRYGVTPTRLRALQK